MGNLDRPDGFDDVFAYRVAKDGKVFVSWNGKSVVTFNGATALRLLGRLEGADRGQVQLVLAKATGNFKHGNER